MARRTPPWSLRPSLNEKAIEAGVDFDEFIALIKEGKEIEEISQTLQSSPKVIASLYEHFLNYGISSVQGGD